MAREARRARRLHGRARAGARKANATLRRPRARKPRDKRTRTSEVSSSRGMDFYETSDRPLDIGVPAGGPRYRAPRPSRRRSAARGGRAEGAVRTASATCRHRRPPDGRRTSERSTRPGRFRVRPCVERFDRLRPSAAMAERRGRGSRRTRSGRAVRRLGRLELVSVPDSAIATNPSAASGAQRGFGPAAGSGALPSARVGCQLVARSKNAAAADKSPRA